MVKISIPPRFRPVNRYVQSLVFNFIHRQECVIMGVLGLVMNG